MERLCEQCGALVSGSVKFCPVCGAFMHGAVDLGKPETPQQDIMPPGAQSSNRPAGYDSGNYGYSAPQFNTNITPRQPEAKMSTGEWFVTIFLCSSLGLVSFILNLAWGFGANTAEPRRSYCRARLLFSLISGVFSTFFILIFAAVFGSQIADFFKGLS